MNFAETHAAQVFLAHHDFVKGVALKYAPWPGLMEDITPQIAEQIQMKADTVWRALSRAREKLRECIQQSINQGGHAHA